MEQSGESDESDPCHLCLETGPSGVLPECAKRADD